MVRVQNSKKSGGGGGGKSAKIGVKKSGMKRRRSGGGGSSSGGGKIVDARMKIIAKNRSKVVDARDKLVKLAKGTDARQKLQKIRNLKEGKLDVKTTSKGGITITTTTQGKLLLTTSKKSGSANVSKKSPMAPNKKLARDALRQTAGGGISSRNRGRGQIRSSLTSSSKLNDSHRGFRSDAGHQRRSDSGDRRPQTFRRSRSPVRIQASSRHQRAAPFDYDDPRRAMEREEDVYRKRFQHEPEHDIYRGRTLADRVLESGGNHTSPLQGTKVIVTNLLPSVTQEDIAELFSDVGPLKRAKVTTPGTAEVVYINYNDAQRAIDVYHNRQLDGRSMKCQIVGQSGTVSESKIASLYRSSGGAEGPSPDLTAIHKALFSDKRRPMGSSSGSRTQFSVTVSNKKSSRHYY